VRDRTSCCACGETGARADRIAGLAATASSSRPRRPSGQANEAVIRVLANFLGIKASAIELRPVRLAAQAFVLPREAVPRLERLEKGAGMRRWDRVAAACAAVTPSLRRNGGDSARGVIEDPRPCASTNGFSGTGGFAVQGTKVASSTVSSSTRRGPFVLRPHLDGRGLEDRGFFGIGPGIADADGIPRWLDGRCEGVRCPRCSSFSTTMRSVSTAARAAALARRAVAGRRAHARPQALSLITLEATRLPGTQRDGCRRIRRRDPVGAHLAGCPCCSGWQDARRPHPPV